MSGLVQGYNAATQGDLADVAQQNANVNQQAQAILDQLRQQALTEQQYAFGNKQQADATARTAAGLVPSSMPGLNVPGLPGQGGGMAGAPTGAAGSSPQAGVAPQVGGFGTVNDPNYFRLQALAAQQAGYKGDMAGVMAARDAQVNQLKNMKDAQVIQMAGDPQALDKFIGKFADQFSNYLPGLQFQPDPKGGGLLRYIDPNTGQFTEHKLKFEDKVSLASALAKHDIDPVGSLNTIRQVAGGLEAHVKAANDVATAAANSSAQLQNAASAATNAQTNAGYREDMANARPVAAGASALGRIVDTQNAQIKDLNARIADASDKDRPALQAQLGDLLRRQQRSVLDMNLYMANNPRVFGMTRDMAYRSAGLPAPMEAATDFLTNRPNATAADIDAARKAAAGIHGQYGADFSAALSQMLAARQQKTNAQGDKVGAGRGLMIPTQPPATARPAAPTVRPGTPAPAASAPVTGLRVGPNYNPNQEPAFMRFLRSYDPSKPLINITPPNAPLIR